MKQGSIHLSPNVTKTSPNRFALRHGWRLIYLKAILLVLRGHSHQQHDVSYTRVQVLVGCDRTSGWPQLLLPTASSVMCVALSLPMHTESQAIVRIKGRVGGRDEIWKWHLRLNLSRRNVILCDFKWNPHSFETLLRPPLSL